MKKIFKMKNILIGGIIFILGSFIFLFFDAFYGGQNFRTMGDPIYSMEKVNLTGLRDIKASGGNLPRFPYITWKLSHVKEPKYLLDLKCEFHGYIHGIPTTFFGYNRALPGARHIPRRLLLTGTTKIRPELAVPESEKAKEYGFIYKSIDIGSKFIAADQKIDEIVDFFDNLPENSWLHIHCTNGAGRTSTALAMLDMMKNAPEVSLDDIIRRQYLLGGMNLYDTEVWPGGTYTKAELENRKKFIEQFYKFICQRKMGGIQRWSEWNKQQSDGKINLSPLAFNEVCS